jgi:hypothetical protein
MGDILYSHSALRLALDKILLAILCSIIQNKGNQSQYRRGSLRRCKEFNNLAGVLGRSKPVKGVPTLSLVHTIPAADTVAQLMHTEEQRPQSPYKEVGS